MKLFPQSRVRQFLSLAALSALAFLTGCQTLEKQATRSPSSPIYSPKPWFSEEGVASWYGGRWIGRLTANGERYRANDMTAAHKKLPFNTRVRVTNLKTGKQVIVRINNRGPYVRGRIIDLSVAAAKELGTYAGGLARVRIDALKEIPLAGPPNLRVPPGGPQKKSQEKPREPSSPAPENQKRGLSSPKRTPPPAQKPSSTTSRSKKPDANTAESRPKSIPHQSLNTPAKKKESAVKKSPPPTEPAAASRNPLPAKPPQSSRNTITPAPDQTAEALPQQKSSSRPTVNRPR